jgi:thioredoxin-like negative regulator of GroEL
MNSAAASLAHIKARVANLPVQAIRPPRFKPHAVVMALLFLAALGVAYVLLPGDSERIAMLERDGKSREALTILQSRFNVGDRSQRTLYQLQSLYESAGDLPRTRQTLEQLAKSRPRDLAIQRQLGAFYKQTQDEPAYISSLLQQIEMRYSENACREVTGLLRRSGQYEREQAALQTCRQKGYRKTEDMVRLASLLAADGDVGQASVLLRSVDDLRRLTTNKERMQLFSILIENNQPKEAQRRAARWVRGSKDDTLALTLIADLVADNKHDLAIELARETSVPGDSVFLSVAEIMVERTQLVAAQAILRGWLDKTTSQDPAVMSRFVVTALDVGDPDLALKGAQHVGLQGLPTETNALLAQAMDAAGRRRDGDMIRASMKRAPVSQAQPGAIANLAKPVGRFTWGSGATNLDEWRTSLWRRLIDENTIKTNAALGNTVAPNKLVRSPNALKTLKRSRRAAALRQRGKATPAVIQPQPATQPFNFLAVPAP